MQAVTSSAIRELADWSDGWCVSLFLGGHPVAGVEVGDTLRVKNQMRGAEAELVELGMRRPEAGALVGAMMPSELTDPDSRIFHRGGLAVFAADGLHRSFRLSFDTPDLVTVSLRFHLTPLLGELEHRRRFFVLAVSRGYAALFAGRHESLVEVDVSGMPRSMDEALEYDDRERALLSHSAARSGTGSVVAAFHGQGDRSDHLSEDTARYLRMVDEAVAPVVGERPVVLAGSRDVVAFYRRIANHDTCESAVFGNPEIIGSDELHARAREIVDAGGGDSLEIVRADVDRLLGTGLASSDPEIVIEAARAGRVASMVLTSGARRWGRLDPEGGEARVHEERQPGDQDLLDEAAVRAWMAGAALHVVPQGELPEGVAVAAVFRY